MTARDLAHLFVNRSKIVVKGGGIDNDEKAPVDGEKDGGEDRIHVKHILPPAPFLHTFARGQKLLVGPFAGTPSAAARPRSISLLEKFCA